jgi:hypothetical protein
METQSAQLSPDTNHLDLHFFRALQSRKWDYGYATNTDELIAQEFVPCQIDFGLLTLQSCIIKILELQGENNYAIPHMGKEDLLCGARGAS